MRITPFNNRKIAANLSAFTLPEVMMGVMIMSVMIVSLYLGLSQGFAVIQISRENIRATQILQEKMEAIRLYTWDQINTDGFVPANFSEYSYDKGSASARGVLYTGTFQKTADPTIENYAVDQRLVTFTLTWRSGNVQRQRQMQTLVSRYGLQNYIYSAH